MKKSKFFKKLGVSVLAGILSINMAFPVFAASGDDVANADNYYSSLKKKKKWYQEQYGLTATRDDYNAFHLSMGLLELAIIEEADRYSSSYYGTITDVYWDGMTARWDYSSSNEGSFQVKLYRNGSLVTTKSTSKTRYNFSSMMDEPGNYYFKVRCETSSGWSSYETSEKKTIRTSGSSSSSGTVLSNSAGPGAVMAGSWLQAADGSGRWWYRHNDGGYTKSNWELINNKWYYFNDQGWMTTGWITWNGRTYYCEPNGAMVTGNRNIDGVNYYFDASGVMTR